MAKKKEKPGVMMYWPMFDVLESLEAGQSKTMLKSIREYSQHGIEPDFGNDSILKALWVLTKPQIDADTERYETIRAQRVAAVNARWEKEGKKQHSN